MTLSIRVTGLLVKNAPSLFGSEKDVGPEQLGCLAGVLWYCCSGLGLSIGLMDGIVHCRRSRSGVQRNPGLSFHPSATAKKAIHSSQMRLGIPIPTGTSDNVHCTEDTLGSMNSCSSYIRKVFFLYICKDSPIAKNNSTANMSINKI